MAQVTIAVGVITDDLGRVFLTQRNQPGSLAHLKWQFPGGGVEQAEDPLETVIREVKEETNMDVEVIRLLPRVISNHFQETDFHAIIICYHCRWIRGDFQRIDPETMDGRFFAKEEINYDDCLPQTKEIIELLER